MNKRQYSSIYIVFVDRNVFIEWWYGSIYIVFFNRKTLIKRQYVSTHFVFLENFDKKRIQFKPFCIFKKFWSKTIIEFWSKENVVQPILPLLMFLLKNNGSTYIGFWENFNQNKTRFNVYSFAGLENFDQKIILFNPCVFVENFDKKVKRFNPLFLSTKF